MSDDQIYNAFSTKLEAFAAGFSPAMRVEFPGVGFTPPTAGAWFEVRWFPNETQNYGMPNDAPSLQQGFGQVSVCTRPGGGIVDSLALAGQVIAEFAKGTELANVRVYRKPWTSSVLIEPDRVMLPVSIPWRGFDA